MRAFAGCTIIRPTHLLGREEYIVKDIDNHPQGLYDELAGILEKMNKTIDDVYDNGLTEEEAYYLCMNDIAIVEKELLDSKPVVNQLTDVRQMVLVDMAFNMGVPRLKLFKNMWLAIEKVNYPLACAEMLDSKWANQVGKRAVRLSEAMKNGEWI